MNIVRSICFKLYDTVNKCISPSDDDIHRRLIEIQMKEANKEETTTGENQRKSQPNSVGEARSLLLKQKLNQLGTSVVKFGARNKNKRLSEKHLDDIFSNTKRQNTVVDMRNSKPFNKKQERVINQHLKLQKKRSWSTDNMESVFNKNVDIAGAMSEWNQRHYIYFKHHYEYSYLSQAMKMKLSRNIFLGLANKKLQKFLSSLSTQRVSERKSRRGNSPQSVEIKDEYQRSKKGQYSNDEIGLKCLYRRKKSKHNSQPSENQQLSYQKLCTFHCNASDPLAILKWFNNQKTWEGLFNIINMRLVENQRYSVIQCEQFSSGLVNKRFYTVVRQIQVTKFDNLPGKLFVIQTDKSFGKDETFHNTLKFEISKFSKVEIFTQSSERTKGSHHTVFMSQWKALEQSLIANKLPKKDDDFMQIEENVLGQDDVQN